jgi:hypothetical protein
MNRRLKRWGIWSLVCMVALVGTILAIGHWGNGSSDGTVHIGKPVAQDPSVPTTPLDIKTQYFTTTLPAGFTLKRQTETPEGSSTHLQLVANTKGVNDQQFAATSGVMPPGGLNDIGDYNLRVADTTTYSRTSPTALPSGAVAFRNVSGLPTLVVFWPHGTSYIELAFSTDGGASYQLLETTYAQVMNDWAWQ